MQWATIMENAGFTDQPPYIHPSLFDESVFDSLAPFNKFHHVTALCTSWIKSTKKEKVPYNAVLWLSVELLLFSPAIQLLLIAATAVSNVQ
jgi:hypothetical protein